MRKKDERNMELEIGTRVLTTKEIRKIAVNDEGAAHYMMFFRIQRHLATCPECLTKVLQHIDEGTKNGTLQKGR